MVSLPPPMPNPDGQKSAPMPANNPPAVNPAMPAPAPAVDPNPLGLGGPNVFGGFAPNGLAIPNAGNLQANFLKPPAGGAPAKANSPKVETKEIKNEDGSYRIETISTNPNGNVISTKVENYDKDGKITSSVTTLYAENGDIARTEVIKYSYYEDGKLLSTDTETTNYNADGSTSASYTVTINGQIFMTGGREKDPQGRLTSSNTTKYEYDKDGNLIASTTQANTYTDKGKIQSSTINTYDGEGNHTGTTVNQYTSTSYPYLIDTYDPNGNLTSTTVNNYDNNNQLTTSTITNYTSDGSTTITTNTHGANGIIIESKPQVFPAP